MSRPALPGAPEAFSLFGEPLYSTPPPADSPLRARYAEALADWEANPGDADAIIWLGRRTAYLGRHREAAAIFTVGARSHPDDARMLRHRGHRFVTLRHFDHAIEDLEKAVTLEVGRPDQAEPDGAPNARGIPLSTLQRNIWYHLGLANYLAGDLDAAYTAYTEGNRGGGNLDNQISCGYWLYQILEMLGRPDEAVEALKPFRSGQDVVENFHYHRCLLMFRGESTPEQVMEWARSQGAGAVATAGYGVGNYYMINGDEQKAAEVWREVLATGAWGSFGFIAAEADMKRLCLPLI